METLTLFALIIATLAATTIAYYLIVRRPVQFMDAPTDPRTSERVEVAHQNAARALTRNIASPDREEVALAGAVMASTPVFAVAFERINNGTMRVCGSYYKEEDHTAQPVDLELRHPYAKEIPEFVQLRFCGDWVANEVNKAINEVKVK